MSNLRLLSLLALLALGTGCCLTRPCGNTPYTAAVGDCDPCAAPGCGSCATPGCHGCLGLGRLRKLFCIHGYGCNGCGETYFHDWINDPPTPDPCDCDGNWTGSSSGSCGNNTYYHGDIGYGLSIGETGACGSGCSGCNSCGETACLGGCGSDSCCLFTGRLLYRTWMGVGNIIRGFRCGFLPSCGTCHAFSISGTCHTCASSHYFGGAGNCNSCEGSVVAVQEEAVPTQLSAASPTPLLMSAPQPPQPVIRRPPHPVIADRSR